LDIKVTAQPNSFVGLLGVDQSVLLLKSGNDIESSAVVHSLEDFNTPTKWNHQWYNDQGHYRNFPDSSVVITNAKQSYSEKPKSFNNEN
jgi:CD109 antigen